MTIFDNVLLPHIDTMIILISVFVEVANSIAFFASFAEIDSLKNFDNEIMIASILENPAKELAI